MNLLTWTRFMFLFDSPPPSFNSVMISCPHSDKYWVMSGCRMNDVWISLEEGRSKDICHTSFSFSVVLTTF